MLEWHGDDMDYGLIHTQRERWKERNNKIKVSLTEKCTKIIISGCTVLFSLQMFNLTYFAHYIVDTEEVKNSIFF